MTQAVLQRVQRRIGSQMVCLVGFMLMMAITACAGSTSSTPTNATPGTTVPAQASSTENATEPVENSSGAVEFIGKVLRVGTGSIDVSMPDGSTLTVLVNSQTNLSRLGGVQPSVGQTLTVTANANSDGSFTAIKFKPTDSADNASVVIYRGITTGTVSSDRVLHFKVGPKSLSFPLAPNADLALFQNNVQSIGNNVAVVVRVQFQGSTGTVIAVSQS